jgi:hypothetical protein
MSVVGPAAKGNQLFFDGTESSDSVNKVSKNPQPHDPVADEQKK